MTVRELIRELARLVDCDEFTIKLECDTCHSDTTIPKSLDISYPEKLVVLSTVWVE